MKLYISEENLTELVLTTLKEGYTMKQIHDLLDEMNVITNVKEIEKNEKNPQDEPPLLYLDRTYGRDRDSGAVGQYRGADGFPACP